MVFSLQQFGIHITNRYLCIWRMHPFGIKWVRSGQTEDDGCGENDVRIDFLHFLGCKVRIRYLRVVDRTMMGFGVYLFKYEISITIQSV